MTSACCPTFCTLTRRAMPGSPSGSSARASAPAACCITSPQAPTLTPYGRPPEANETRLSLTLARFLRAIRWKDISITSPQRHALQREKNLEFWCVLHEIIETEPSYEPFRNQYGELAALGIVKGKPFPPDTDTRKLVEGRAKRALTEQGMPGRRSPRRCSLAASGQSGSLDCH